MSPTSEHGAADHGAAEHGAPGSHGAPDPSHEPESVYAGLFGGDSDQWAFGTDFDDPLAGLDAAVPGGASRADLAAYCLMLGDDALVASHRLAEWTSRAPDLEIDIALANIALDLLGQARMLLIRAARVDPGVVPALPDGSPVPAEDALAFFRPDRQFRNVRLVEGEGGDFGQAIARLLLFSAWRLALLSRLAGRTGPASTDAVLAAVAAKGVKEVTYHRDFAARWFVTLAQGTPESRRRVTAGLAQAWRYRAELFTAHPAELALAAAGVAVDPASLAAEVDAALGQVLAASGLEPPDVPPAGMPGGRPGRDGVHTEALSAMLAPMQAVARAHPQGRW
ncbi:MAG TPA: 1,2-phenylacetyl-CoA epoxidase subunit PaaC [Trebonia sp.]|nr:1,2-phenylacetyl-CoA epoxidase subunit PaaC [Trebonia sp.]